MPIKQVVCKICGQTVNKAQTYHVGNGDRACKSHEGVVEKRDALQVEQKKASENWRAKEKARLDAMFHRDEKPVSLKPKCWVCMNEGLRQDEFFTRILVEMEKLCIIHGGPVNIFDPKFRVGMSERCIFVLVKEKCEPVMKYIRDEFMMGVQWMGIVAICGPCCSRFQIDPMRKVEWDELVAHGNLYQMVKPAFQKIAGLELARDN